MVHVMAFEEGFDRVNVDVVVEVTTDQYLVSTGLPFDQVSFKVLEKGITGASVVVLVIQIFEVLSIDRLFPALEGTICIP